jgi:hypothetical protein
MIDMNINVIESSVLNLTYKKFIDILNIFNITRQWVYSDEPSENLEESVFYIKGYDNKYYLRIYCSKQKFLDTVRRFNKIKVFL